jgi:4-hydroxy-3-polyprenylbenzoate decarboxylase
MKEVIWAMTTRADPKTDIESIENCWATALDPRMPPEQTANGPFTNSRAIFYAVRPWGWKDKFPPVNRIDKDQREAIPKKYGDVFAFPRR